MICKSMQFCLSNASCVRYFKKLVMLLTDKHSDLINLIPLDSFEELPDIDKA